MIEISKIIDTKEIKMMLHGIYYSSTEIQYEAAHTFVKHFKGLSKRYNNDTIMLSQKELYEGFEYSAPMLAYAKRYRPAYSVSEAYEHAITLGFLNVDKATKPFSYTLTKKTELLLRPYQNSIVKTVKHSEGSVLIEAPTGSGKSVIACEIAKNEIAKGGKVLIVAPKTILLDQLQETFTQLEPQIIHGSKDYDNTHSVFISTLQTAHKRELGFEPTMIIIDEVHFGFSGKMLDKLLKDFSGRLIGLSATPYDQNGEAVKGFDKHINGFDLNYMFQNEYLVKPVCYAPVEVDLSNITVQAGDYNQVELDKSFNNLENISQIVKNTKELIDQQKSALIFCINISHSEAVAAAFNAAGVPTKAMHSQLSKQEKKSIMEEYKNGTVKMLANPLMLTTGFDDPATDCIVLARATKSQNLYRQMVGRGLRLFTDKTHAKIIDCAGVIDNLGLPTEPQKPNENMFSKSENVCPKCDSPRIYRKKDSYKNLVRMCVDCNYTQEIEKQGCKCGLCGVINDSSAKYFMRDDSLFLECSQCNHHTLVSTASSAEEFREIFSEAQITELQKQHTIEYIKYLYKMNESIDIPFREDVSKHICAFQMYIAENVMDFIDPTKNIEDIKKYHKPFYSSKYSDKEDYEPDGKILWSWKKHGRLFSLEFEAKILGINVGDVEEQLKGTQDPLEALELIHKLSSSNGKVVLDEKQIQIFRQQLSRTNLEQVEMMCTKRLKDIYQNKEAIEEILKFIPMMESVMHK